MTLNLGPLRQLGKTYSANPFLQYSPMRGMVPFHLSDHPRRFIRSPNKVGKTWAGCYEDWAHAIGRREWGEDEDLPSWAQVLGRERWAAMPEPGNYGIVLLADLDNAYPDFCRQLRALEPSWLLDPAMAYTDEGGYRHKGVRRIKLANGSLIDFRSGNHQQTALAGVKCDWLHINEPPKRGHFTEALRALAVSGGPCWMDFTPVGRPLDWLRLIIDGDAETGTPASQNWETIRARLSVEDCGTVDGSYQRSQRLIDMQVQDMDPLEVPQRRDGEWEGSAVDRRLNAYHPGLLFSDEDSIPGFNALRIGMDYGEGEQNKVAYLEGIVGTAAPYGIWLLKEFTFERGSLPMEDARVILEGLGQLGLTWWDIDLFIGDINSAGALGEGTSINDQMASAFGVLLGLQYPVDNVEPARKGRGSVKAGLRAMNWAMREGRWRVHESCRLFDKSARNYNGGRDFKDALDAARYPVQDELEATRLSFTRGDFVVRL